MGMSVRLAVCQPGFHLRWPESSVTSFHHRTRCRLAQELRWKAASLPPEPSADDAEAVSLAVRLPAGGRYSRRFRRSDTLQVGQKLLPVQHSW